MKFEITEAYDIYGREAWCGNMKERVCYEDIVVDGRIILIF